MTPLVSLKKEFHSNVISKSIIKYFSSKFFIFYIHCYYIWAKSVKILETEGDGLTLRMELK